MKAKVFGTTGDGVIMLSGGEFFNILNHQDSVVRITDIAHALSKQDRASGHFNRRWSVAEHSMLVSLLVGTKCREDSKDKEYTRIQMLAGLLHDASEAYLVDIPRPIKYHKSFKGYLGIEAKLQGYIWESLVSKDTEFDHDLIKWADNEALKYEFRHFMDGWEKMPWCHDCDERIGSFFGDGGFSLIESDWENVKETFIAVFDEIMEGTFDER